MPGKHRIIPNQARIYTIENDTGDLSMNSINVKSANLSLCQRLNYSKLTRCCKKCLPIDNPAIFAFKTLFLWWLVCFCLLHYKQHLKHWAQSVIANKKASWGPRFKYETAGCEARMLPLCYATFALLSNHCWDWPLVPQHTRCRKLSKHGFVFAEKFGPKKFRPLLPFLKKRSLLQKFLETVQLFLQWGHSQI